MTWHGQYRKYPLFKVIGQYRKYPLFKVICCHSGIIDKNNKKHFKCYINDDRNFILFSKLNNHLYTKVLKRTRNDQGELEINILVYCNLNI